MLLPIPFPDIYEYNNSCNKAVIVLVTGGDVMARPVQEGTDHKVALRVTGKYRYAATQPHVKDKETGRISRRYVYWGDVTEDLKFIPNDRYRTALEEDRKKLIFPSNWDMSAAEALREIRTEIPVVTDPYITNDGSAFSGTVSTCPVSDQFNNRFYGGTWFLWEIAVHKHVVEDLLSTFDGNLKFVNDIMTLAMFPILTGWNYSQAERWQSYTMTPSTHPLNPKYITHLTQNINDSHRMRFLKLRIKRQNSKAAVACDSTTRSAYGRCLADIRWGNNKDNKELQNTLEVVVYSLDTHEPIYYRTFGGNENDARTLRTIVSDLTALDCKELTIIFDRGYETEENIIGMIRADQPFLVCGKVGQTPVIDSIYTVKYDAEGMPLNMEYSSEYGFYAMQCEHQKTVLMNPDDPDSALSVTLKINLFLDMKDRISNLTRINEAIRKEEENLRDKMTGTFTEAQIKEMKKSFRYHKLKITNDGNLIVEKNSSVITKEKAIAGFFSSISYKVDGGAIEQYELYVIRDEQEKYFEEMKDQLGFNMQRNSSEDGKTGRLFILFIGLIMRSELRIVWSKKLRKNYPSSIDVLHEMLPIRFVEYDDGSTHITGFTAPQADICRAFSIPIPEDCLSATQKKAIDRATAGRKRGRPKGSLNKKKVAGEL